MLFPTGGQMKAAVYYEHGAPDVLRYEDVEPPLCHPKGMIVSTEAISVEGGDLLDRSGNFAALDTIPRVLGRQAAGTIIEMGTEVTGFHLGQKVVAVRPSGSYAELFAVVPRTCWVVPEGMDVMRAVAVPIAFGTAHDALFHYAGFQPGETLLVQAGASAVGIAALQIGRLHDAGMMLTTASSDERLAYARHFGVNHLINYQQTDVVEAVMRFTNGRGVDIVLDLVGGTTLQGSLRVIARGGRIVALGQASRVPALLDMTNFYHTGATIRGLKLDIASPRLHCSITSLLEDCARGTYEVIIDRVFSLSDAAEAHAHVESRSAIGRVILCP